MIFSGFPMVVVRVVAKRLVVGAILFAGLAALNGCGDSGLAGDFDGMAGMGGAGFGGSDGFGGEVGTGGMPFDPSEFRAGTISVIDMELSNPIEGEPRRRTGAQVTIDYHNLLMADVAPIGDPGEDGSCAVHLYDVQNDPNPRARRTAEGQVAITVDEPFPVDLTCAFDDAAHRYRCPIASRVAEPASAVTTSQSGTMGITLTNFPSPLEGLALDGAFVEIDGLNTPAFNGRFPIIEKFSDHIIVMENLDAIDEAPELVAENMEPVLDFYAGEGPTAARRDFLGLAAAEIGISKKAGPMVPAFEEKIMSPTGANLNLVNGTPQPHEFPSEPADTTFSCDPTDGAGGGNCGPNAGEVYGFILRGRTTDGDLGDLGVTDMPAPVEQYATFECRGLPKMPSVTITEEFVASVLGTNPTRIETELLRVNIDREESATTILVGHGMVGYTDIQ